MSQPNIFKLSQNSKGGKANTRFPLQGKKYITKKVRVVSLACDTPTGTCLCLYQIFQTIKKFNIVRTRIQLRNSFRVLRRQKHELSFLHTIHLLDLIYVPLPIIIKLSQTVWELWPSEDFGFRGHKYIMKKIVVSLAQ